MAKKTRKVASAGRFGSRYGVGIRRKLLKVELGQKQKQTCPNCQFKTIKRVDSGIYNCNKCGHKFAGGAYIPTTLTGGIIRKMVAQKSFTIGLSELTLTKEEAAETKSELAETPEKIK